MGEVRERLASEEADWEGGRVGEVTGGRSREASNMQ